MITPNEKEQKALDLILSGFTGDLYPGIVITPLELWQLADAYQKMVETIWDRTFQPDKWIVSAEPLKAP